MAKFATLLTGMVMSIGGTAASAAVWDIDASHSSASFKIKHLVVANVRGEIGGLKGTIDIDDKNIDKSKVVATLDAATIDTKNADRDKHLRSPDFFNADKCKEIKFESKAVKGTVGNLKVTGPLTLNCVTKDVELSVEGPTAPVKGFKGEWHRGLTATATINRKDFGISWNKTLDGGGLVLSENVDITLDIEVVGQEKPAH